MTRPASVAGEFIVPCKNTHRHRVWVHRDGTVTTPDHDTDMTEKIERGLGFEPTHPCVQFETAAHLHQGHESHLLPATPTGWTLAYESMWTPRAGWTANTAIAGEPIYHNFPPGIVLEYVQAYVVAGSVPDALSTHIQTLLSPWSRATGARRHAPVVAEELTDILRAGIPAERAASALAVGLTGSLVRAISNGVGQYGQPDTELLMMLSYAIDPRQVLRHITATPGLSGQQLKRNCVVLKESLEGAAMSEESAAAVLFSTQ